MFPIKGSTSMWDIPAHRELLSNFFQSVSVNRACDDFILELHHQGITDVFHQQTNSVSGYLEFIMQGGIGISSYQMTQCDDKLHRWFQSLYVVGVIFFYEGGDAFKKFVKYGWGDSREVVEGLSIIQAEPSC